MIEGVVTIAHCFLSFYCAQPFSHYPGFAIHQHCMLTLYEYFQY